MFDLNGAVTGWRRNLARTTTLPRTALDELESHFLDDIDIQMEDGVEPERAYLEAIARLGDPKVLQREFEKNSQGKRWLFAGARLRLAGYMLYQMLVPSVHWGILLMVKSMSHGEGKATWADKLDALWIFLMGTGEFMALALLALLGLLLALRSRQRGWALTFGVSFLFSFVLLAEAWDSIAVGFSQSGDLLVLLVITSMVLSVFTVYPPSLPDALDRLRRA
ncbi:MAG: permease prefix domain 1-containing protein [Bacteroidota bacterium]